MARRADCNRRGEEFWFLHCQPRIQMPLLSDFSPRGGAVTAEGRLSYKLPHLVSWHAGL